MLSHCDWEPVHTAPRDGTAVLLFHPAWDVPQVGVHYDGSASWQQPSGDLLPTPTHWMRLPPGPGDEAEMSE